MRKVRTECVVGNMPECPQCKSWNALLDSRCYVAGTKYFECRDCKLRIDCKDIVIITKTLDAAGMGHQSTHSVDREVDGCDWHLEAFRLTNEK